MNYSLLRRGLTYTGFCILFFWCVQSIVSQNLLIRITSIDITQFPSVKIRYNITRDNNVVPNLNVAQYELLENSILQNIDRADCANDSTTRLSIALLIDRSGSMTEKLVNGQTAPDPDSTKIRAAKAAVRVFIDKLGQYDEAAVFSFSSQMPFPLPANFFDVNQDFTKDQISLRNSLVPIKARGGTLLWKAVNETIRRTKDRTGRKYIIVLTDGKGDPRNDDTKQSVITNALNAKIPIYTIGLGQDVSENELTEIANKTGGKFYKAPDASTLEKIYLDLAKLIITDGCELQYVSSNICLDGTRRNVQLSVRVNNLFAEADTFFVVPDSLSTYTIAAEINVQVTAGDPVEVPLYIREILSNKEPLHFNIQLQFDPNLFRSPRVIQTNTISEGANITSQEISPGQFRITAPDYFPTITSGALCRVEFTSVVIKKDTSTDISITQAELAQSCPTYLKIESGNVSIIPCRAAYTLHSDSTLIGNFDEHIIIPLSISPYPRINEEFSLQTLFYFDSTYFRFEGVDSIKTLSEKINHQIISGTGSVFVQLNGIVSDTMNTVIKLKFVVLRQRQSAISSLKISNPQLDSRCITTVQTEPITILVNGVCQQISKIAVKKQYLRSNPNPFGTAALSGNQITGIDFNVLNDAHVTLRIYDSFGRIIATLLEQQLARGEYRQVFDGGVLPGGFYFALLESNGATIIHRMLLLR